MRESPALEVRTPGLTSRRGWKPTLPSHRAGPRPCQPSTETAL